MVYHFQPVAAACPSLPISLAAVRLVASVAPVLHRIFNTYNFRCDRLAVEARSAPVQARLLLGRTRRAPASRIERQLLYASSLYPPGWPLLVLIPHRHR